MLSPSSSNRPSVFPYLRNRAKPSMGGRGDSENLALACYHCNARKGRNLSGLDPESGALVRRFTLGRTGGMSTSSATESSLLGRSAVARATVGLLKMNAADRRRLRAG
jgi:hypothetical protein